MDDIIVKYGIKQEHIDFLLDYYDKNTDKLVDRNEGDSVPTRLGGKLLLETNFEEIYNIANSIVDCERYLSVSYNFLIKPCSLHIDGSKSFSTDDPQLTDFDTIILIPLRIYPENQLSYSYTIFFDQKAESVDWVRPSFVEAAGEPMRSTIENYTNKPFDNKEHQRWLSNRNIDMFHGFSKKQAFRWNIGGAVIFESSRFHCSSHYFKTDKKLCFVIKTKTNLFRVVSSEAVML